MTLLALTAALALGDIYLQTLVPTSGSGAEKVLDGKADTSWSPEGTPVGEGILFRFEEPANIDSVEVTACPGDPSKIAAVFDGMRYDNPLTPDKSGRSKITVGGFRSMFLKIEQGKGCIAEVAFTGAAGAVRPPRTVHGKVSVSSVLTPVDAYHPGYLFDGRTDFGWVEGSKGTGEGEWLTLTLDAPVTVSAVELWNGYQRSEDHFKKNCRPSKVTFGAEGSEAVPLVLKDVSGPQKLALPKPIKGSTFKLAIDSVIRGTKYTDMVISELRLYDDKGPLQIVTDDMRERQAVLKGEVQGKTLEPLLDTQLRSVCDIAKLSVKLRSNHTFVIYEDTWTGTASVSEVVDGAWIVKSAAAIELFGRRQRISRDDRPYGNGSQETIRITGGPVTVTRVKDLGKEAFEKLVDKWMKGPAKRHVECEQASFEAAADALVLEGVALTGLVAIK